MLNFNTIKQIPRGDFAGLKQNFRYDVVSGFLVFLIALPLCLGIALACGFPASAGIFTVVTGALLTPFISNSELTIKGAPAGLIVIVIGAISDFGFTGGKNVEADLHAYRLVLGVCVAAGGIQILFALLRVGALSEFFPRPVIHGMLAAIGIIIILKQFPIALGGHAEGEPFKLILSIPEKIIHMNPCIAAIGAGSLAIMFGIPMIRNRYLKVVPAPLFVLMFAVPLGLCFGLSHEHAYHFMGSKYEVGEDYLVNIQGNMLNVLTYPDFSSLKTIFGWKWVIMFALIGSLESLISAKAIDAIDPWKRKTNLNRDLLGIGIGNTVTAFIGGLPMISEIVRSKTNIVNGARTRFAGIYHGLFLLMFVATVPFLLHYIPLAALAAMIINTGFRLTAPREYAHVYHIGKEQFIIFMVTVISVLTTDLAIGIGIGIGTKFLIHFINGVPLHSFFRPYYCIDEINEETCTIRVGRSIIFSNWIPFKKQIEQAGLARNKNVIIDLSVTKMVDHSVMENILQMQDEFRQNNLKLELIGLDSHKALSDHHLSTHRRGIEKIKRIIVFTDASLQSLIEYELNYHGVRDFTAIVCSGTKGTPTSRIRLEVLARPDKAEHILDELRRQIVPLFGKKYEVKVYVKEVEAILPVFNKPKQAMTFN